MPVNAFDRSKGQSGGVSFGQMKGSNLSISGRRFTVWEYPATHEHSVKARTIILK
jgi:hypothetical protein